jgi:hypothetical protein
VPRMADEAPKEKPKLPIGFTPEQRVMIEKWMDTHWKGRTCPMCGVGTFLPANYIIHPDLFTAGRESVSQVGYFYIPINCNNCWYTVFLNAVSLGLWEKYEDGE